MFELKCTLIPKRLGHSSKKSKGPNVPPRMSKF